MLDFYLQVCSVSLLKTRFVVTSWFNFFCFEPWFLLPVCQKSFFLCVPFRLGIYCCHEKILVHFKVYLAYPWLFNSTILFSCRDYISKLKIYSTATNYCFAQNTNKVYVSRIYEVGCCCETQLCGCNMKLWPLFGKIKAVLVLHSQFEIDCIFSLKCSFVFPLIQCTYLLILIISVTLRFK